MTTPEFLIGAALVLPLVLLFGLFLQHFVLPHLISYRFAERSVRVVLFGVVTLSATSYANIEEVRIVGWAESFLYLFSWKATNRLNGPFVAIHKKWGLPVMISPEDPEGFVRELRRRVYEQTGEWPLAS